jgi:Saccharopine dehydrogenase NADP binding domain
MNNATGTAHHRIVVVGGYGAFGARAVERLAREPDLDIVVAGRSMIRAEQAVAAGRATSRATLSAHMIDAVTPDVEALRQLSPRVVINASGPFQTQSFALAHAAIEVGAHYIDLADAAAFVATFAQDKALHAAAVARGVLVVSGASTVPAISSAVVDHYVRDFSRLEAIHHGVSPGNSFDPGPATTASVLSAVGRPYLMWRDAGWHTVHGWQGWSSHRFPSFGSRPMGYCNVPDLTLFPNRYTDVRTVDFKAGVEVSLFHFGLWALSWGSRWGLIRRPEMLTGGLLAAKRYMGFLGSDIGGMFVELSGVDHTQRAKRVSWHLEARRGHGPYIPTTPAVILARKFVRDTIGQTGPQSGAFACMGFVTLAEIETELADLAITMSGT